MNNLRYPAFPQSNSTQATLDIFDKSYGVVVAGQLLLQKILRENDNEDLDKNPQSATRHFLDDIIPSGVWKNVTWNGWELVGQGYYLESCGHNMILGCPHVVDHPRNKIFVNMVKKKCARSSCSKCFESWTNREANSMTRRIFTWMQRSKQKASHVTVSLPEHMHNWDNRKITKYLKKVYKKAGITGGYKILHPWRFDKSTGAPSLWVHYHLICFGWIKNTVEIERETGVLIKKISTLYDEGNIFATSKYQLTHCAIKKGRHAAVPFGSISYSKLKIEKPEIEPNLCPFCERELVILRIDPYKLDKPPPFDEDFVGLTNYDGLIPIEKYDVIYYDNNFKPVASSKELAQTKRVRNEKIKQIKNKIKLKLDKKSKYCAVLENYI